MAIDDETRAALREMGLNAYEIDSYLVLRKRWANDCDGSE